MATIQAGASIPMPMSANTKKSPPPHESVFKHASCVIVIPMQASHVMVPATSLVPVNLSI